MNGPLDFTPEAEAQEGRCRADGLEPGSIYVHDQNRSEYVVEMIARNPNTLKLVVVYKGHGDEGLFPYYWRPLQEFRSKFTRKRK